MSKEGNATSKNISDHDILIETRTLVGILIKGQDNHLENHRRRDIAMLSVMLGSIITSFAAIGCAIISYMK